MNNKILKKKMIRHGEVLLLPVSEIPTDAKEVFTGKEYIVAHSETGHHHVAVGEIKTFQSGENFFLEAVKESRVEHRKTFEKHETKTLFKGLYQVVIKKQYDYFAKALTRVMD